MPEPQHCIAQEQSGEAEEGQDKDVKEGSFKAVVDDLLLQVLLDACLGVQLNDPEQGDEEQVEGDEQTEGAADVGDGPALLRQRRWEEVRGEALAVG